MAVMVDGMRCGRLAAQQVLTPIPKDFKASSIMWGFFENHPK